MLLLVKILTLPSLAGRKPPVWPPPPSEAPPVPSEVGPVPLPATVATPARVRPASPPSRRPAPAALPLEFGGRGLGAEPLDLLGAAGQVGLRDGEVGGVGLGVEVAVGQSGAHRQPAWGETGRRRALRTEG